MRVITFRDFFIVKNVSNLNSYGYDNIFFVKKINKTILSTDLAYYLS